MKTNCFFIGAIALLSVLSCQKEELLNNNTDKELQCEIITCSLDTTVYSTKTSEMGGKFSGTIMWANNDEIMLYDGISKTQKLTLANSGTPSSTTGIIKSFPTQFTFVKPAGWTNVYAIYPYSACVTDFDPSDPKLNFAGQDGTFGKANISAAAEMSGSMIFKNVGAIFQIFYNNYTTLPEIQYVEIPVAGLAKDYQLTFSGQTPSLAPVDATNSNVFSVTPWSNATKYFGVPAGTLPKGSTFIYRSSSKAIVAYQIISNATTTTVNEKYVFPYVKASDKLPGVFSVSSETKVRFSKGNLRAKNVSGTWGWGFFDNQYDVNPYPTSSGSRTPAATDSVIDLFCWGYDAAGSVNPIEERNASSFTDWGTAIDNKGTWRTLSHSEWTYLLNIEKKSSNARTQTNRYAKANVKGINGLIIFPDGYNGTTAVTGQGIATVNNKTASFPTKSIPDSEWIAMESNGCVFLPMSGMRWGDFLLEGVGTDGYYWSSSTGDSEGQSWHIQVSGSDATTETASDRDMAYSVRLVSVIANK